MNIIIEKLDDLKILAKALDEFKNDILAKTAKRLSRYLQSNSITKTARIMIPLFKKLTPDT